MTKDDHLVTDEDRVPTETVDVSDKLPSGRGSRQHVYAVILTGQKAGAVYRIGRHETILGRSPSCDISIPDEGISREHAKLTRQGPMIRLLDMESTNGTFVDKKRVTQKCLNDGDRFELAGTLLKVYFGDELEETLQRGLYESSVRDWLTGLYNRRFLEDRLQSEFAFASRHKSPLSVIFCDLDRLDKINSEHGRRGGDDALRDVAEALKQVTRAEDIVARYSGQEFVILARQTGMSQAHQLAERVRAVVESLDIQSRQMNIKVTLSAGVSSFEPGLFESPHDLIEAAARALNQAKKQGRNCIVSHDLVADPPSDPSAK